MIDLLLFRLKLAALGPQPSVLEKPRVEGLRLFLTVRGILDKPRAYNCCLSGVRLVHPWDASS
jgi:hypothetical protein